MSKALHCAGTAMVIDWKAMEARAGTLAPMQVAAEQPVDAWRAKRREALERRIQAGLCWWDNAAAVSVDGAQRHQAGQAHGVAANTVKRLVRAAEASRAAGNPAACVAASAAVGTGRGRDRHITRDRQGQDDNSLFAFKVFAFKVFCAGTTCAFKSFPGYNSISERSRDFDRVSFSSCRAPPWGWVSRAKRDARKSRGTISTGLVQDVLPAHAAA